MRWTMGKGGGVAMAFVTTMREFIFAWKISYDPMMNSRNLYLFTPSSELCFPFDVRSER